MQAGWDLLSLSDFAEWSGFLGEGLERPHHVFQSLKRLKIASLSITLSRFSQHKAAFSRSKPASGENGSLVHFIQAAFAPCRPAANRRQVGWVRTGLKSMQRKLFGPNAMNGLAG